MTVAIYLFGSVVSKYIQCQIWVKFFKVIFTITMFRKMLHLPLDKGKVQSGLFENMKNTANRGTK